MENKYETLIGVAFAFSIMLIAVIGIKTYESVPTIGQNPDGKCEWIITEGVEKKACPLVLPAKYSVQYVWFKDSKNGR